MLGRQQFFDILAAVTAKFGLADQGIECQFRMVLANTVRQTWAQSVQRYQIAPRIFLARQCAGQLFEFRSFDR